jgi:hypothetical protein
VSYLHPEKEPERIKSSMAPPPPPPARPATSAIQHVLERETVLFTCVRGEKRFLLYICLLVSERAAYAFDLNAAAVGLVLLYFLGSSFLCHNKLRGHAMPAPPAALFHVVLCSIHCKIPPTKYSRVSTIGIALDWISVAV